ncbi:hypothetical protein ONR75_24240 [Rhodopseudomonas sp. P2A-2r]|uniref:hypothetical protein n=1 Tax=Rhodopseudomonas sp. P2A-2r TaxID=2991972 RepID=UPI0022340007|nr:hypothetical protein [Rhodopseudomonas sp. P2A-2r]UZE47950.1 hypothetical protein ONR75_24240 [Rhodopseudomonas sp. P2A-2r]
MTVKLRYIKWREGRPRLTHGPRERAMGLLDRDLIDPDTGRWLTYEQAKEVSDKHAAEVARLRSIGARALPPKPARIGTVEDLLEDWLASQDVRKLAPSSIASYRKASRAIIFRPESREQAADRRKRERAAAVLGVTVPERERERIASATPSSIQPPEMRALFNYLKSVRGHHMALAAIAALSAAFSWGRESAKWRLKTNPRIDMQFDRPAGRVVMITMEEFTALVAAADAMGRASIGDAIYLGLFTGQRQTDRLALRDEGLQHGRRHFRQSKTGALVAIKETPQLAERLAGAKARVAALKLRLGLREMPDTIVVDENTGKPYNEHTYRHLFAEIRDLAIKGHGDVAPCPTLAFTNENSGAPDFKHDQDLRDTCVMLLDRSGSDLMSICDVTGHSYQSAQMIMKHYRARNPERADAAIDRLVAFISTTEFGQRNS